MKDETKFKEKVKKDLKTLSRIWILKTNEVSMVGIPDYLLCICGIFIAIELKANKKSDVSILQQYNLEKIELAGGIGLVAYPENWEAIFKLLKRIDKRGNSFAPIKLT